MYLKDLKSWQFEVKKIATLCYSLVQSNPNKNAQTEQRLERSWL